MPQLVYETTDTDFADRAIEALRDADISCYRTGRGYSANVQNPHRGSTEDQVCIYIDKDSDYAQANQILIELGAVTDDVHLPPVWVVALLAAAAVLIGSWVASQWK